MKAILKNGLIHPKEAVPSNWVEGTELEVEKSSTPSANGAPDDLDNWYAELESSCAQMDAEDSRILRAAVFEVKRQEKERARKEAGL